MILITKTEKNTDVIAVNNIFIRNEEGYLYYTVDDKYDVRVPHSEDGFHYTTRIQYSDYQHIAVLDAGIPIYAYTNSDGLNKSFWKNLRSYFS